MTEPSPTSDEQTFSLLQLVAIVLHRRKLVVSVAIVWTLLLVVPVLFKDRTYTARAAFVPQSSGNSAGKLAGLAAQFGVNVGGGGDDATQSADFYAELVRSDYFLSQLLDGPYKLADGTTSTLVPVLRKDNADKPALRRELAQVKLKELVAVETGLKTSIVLVSVKMVDRDVALQVAQRALDLINEFNQTKRQSQARKEWEFVEGRLAQVRQDLKVAEDNLVEFMRRNRDFRQAPLLVVEHDRLQREVDVRQQVYTSLSQAAQQAQIDAVRNTPVTSLVQPPMAKVRPDPRRLSVRGMLSLVAGTILGMGIALALEFLSENRRRAPALLSDVEAELRATRNDIRRLFRLKPKP